MESGLPELRDLVDRLDRLVPKEGARLRMPADADGNTTAGTQRGYLRLGVELLRAGLDPTDPVPGERVHVPLVIEYLMTSDSQPPFEVCELAEDPDHLPPRARKLGAVGQLMAALMAVVVLGLIGLGAAAVLSWMMR
jgi:hypothetical protein